MDVADVATPVADEALQPVAVGAHELPQLAHCRLIPLAHSADQAAELGHCDSPVLVLLSRHAVSSTRLDDSGIPRRPFPPGKQCPQDRRIPGTRAGKRRARPWSWLGVCWQNRAARGLRPTAGPLPWPSARCPDTRAQAPPPPAACACNSGSWYLLAIPTA